MNFQAFDYDVDRYIQNNNLRGWDRRYGVNNELYKLTQLVSRADFPDFISETVLEGMEEALQVELIGDRLFTTETTSSPVISWLEEHGFDAEILAEGEAPGYATVRHAKKKFSTVKFGRGLSFTKEALRDIDRMDTLGKHLTKLARAIAYKENQYLLSVAFNGVADGSTRHKTGDVYSNHILDATDGDWTNSGTMDIEKMQLVQTIFDDEEFDNSLMVTSPTTAVAMLSLDDYKSSNVFQAFSAGAEQVADGKTMRPHFLPNNMELLTNRLFPDGWAMFIDENEFGMYFPYEELNMVEMPMDLAQVLRMGFYKESGGVVGKPGAGVLIKNLNTKDPSDYTG